MHSLSSGQYHLYLREVSRTIYSRNCSASCVPLRNILDRDSKFMLKFWRGFHEAMGTKLNVSTSFYPQTDRQTTGRENNQTVEDMLQPCALGFNGSWDRYLSLIEFAYNNSYQASVRMAPYEALYGRHCKSPFC